MEQMNLEQAMKQLEEMNVIDDFLFTEMIADEEYGPEVCRIIISCVLKREVRNIRFTAQKVVPGVSERSHGIRLDAYVTEDTEEGIKVYDVEPDKRSSKKAGLPRRSRYYADLIDVQLLKAGTDYGKLPELVTIFILSYDPFGENAMYYEAGTVIKTHPHIPYDDGIRRIFLYADGELPEDADEGEKKIKNLVTYIRSSTGTNVVDENTRKLDSIVRNTKSKEDIGIRIMKSWEREQELIEEVRKEEQIKYEREKERADKAEERAEKAERALKDSDRRIAEAKAKAENDRLKAEIESLRKENAELKKLVSV